jgi:hypothetical protein
VELATEKEAGPESWVARVRRRLVARGVRPPLLARDRSPAPFLVTAAWREPPTAAGCVSSSIGAGACDADPSVTELARGALSRSRFNPADCCRLIRRR